LLIKTCHKRGAFAMGGMAAFIPIKNDKAANENAIAKVKADKEREAGDGHDGTWVAHPGLIATAREVFDRLMPRANQLDKLRQDVEVKAADLLEVPKGEITEEGLRNNIAVSLRYLESWLRGQGCVPIFNLMEDAATAEISRAQLWQWIKHKAKMADGEIVTAELFRKILAEEMAKIKAETPAVPYEKAAKFLETLVLSPDFPEFLTIGAYRMIG
jgi:malate synthase